jgi:hypothetical protein
MSSQNLISLNLSPDQWTAVDGALTVIESHLGSKIAIPDRKTVPQMGPKSEQFARHTMSALRLNPQLVPASMDMSDAQGDLAALDQLLPRLQRLEQVIERANDARFALGSDVMAAALQGYKLLKLTGQSHGLEGLREALGERFTKKPRKPAKETVDA